MKLTHKILMLATMAVSAHAFAASPYLEGYDESLDDARYRFIADYARDDAKDISKKQFDQAWLQKNTALFAGKATLSKQEYVAQGLKQLDADFKSEREGQTRQTRVRFDSIDTNKDGFIDLREFQTVGLRSFDRYDTNKDGLISAADDQNAVEAEATRKPGEDEARRLKGLLSMPTTHNAKGFLALYGNGSQQLSQAGYLAHREEQYARTDTDKDGRVSPEEYLAEFLTRVDVQGEKSKQQLREALEARFDAIDKAKKGQVSLKDVKVFGEQYFKFWDTNKDGKVNKTETLPAL